jgi:hypothetical protein
LDACTEAVTPVSGLVAQSAVGWLVKARVLTLESGAVGPSEQATATRKAINKAVHGKRAVLGIGRLSDGGEHR